MKNREGSELANWGSIVMWKKWKDEDDLWREKEIEWTRRTMRTNGQ